MTVDKVRARQLGWGPYQGHNIIGEVSEALHKHLLDGWHDDERPLEVQTDITKEPTGSARVVYAYMYRVARNTALLNSKRERLARVTIGKDPATARHFYERPPLYLDLYYLVAVHAQHRREAEKLLGWVLLRLNEATHLVYRPRRYVLPDGTEVDATGAPWTSSNEGEGVIMEKVSVDIVDDLTIGDALNFFSTHDAPYRPYVTYRARCAMEGALKEALATTVRSTRSATMKPPGDGKPKRIPRRTQTSRALRSGRGDGPAPTNEAAPPETEESVTRTPFGPPGFGHERYEDENHED